MFPCIRCINTPSVLCRTSFVADASAGHALLWFKGLNYRADVVVNGVTVANNTTIAGAYRYYDFDVTNVLKFGEVTTLEVVVYPPNDPVRTVLAWLACWCFHPIFRRFSRLETTQLILH